MSRRPEDDGTGGGRLNGWSRRKLAARRGASGPPDTAEETPAATVADLSGEPDSVDAEYTASLPPIETIAADSDIKPFLAKGVPASLKNAALRRLWSAAPGVRDYSDPAVDYAWDWNAPGGVPGGGGALSESGVAKMVKNLIGGSRGEDADPAAVTDAVEARKTDAEPGRREAATDAQVPDMDPVPVSIRRTEKRREPDRDGDPDRSRAPEGGRQTVASTVPQRRHGGALPD